MFKNSAWAVLAVLLSFASPASGQGKLDPLSEGAASYRACAGCHSLRPGVHLSGPSLAGLWGRKAATAPGYGRYSPALDILDLVWDEAALDGWLQNPEAVAPGTTMRFRGIEDADLRASLIAFLRLAMSETGNRRVVGAGLIAESMADGQIPPDLSAVGPEQRVEEIRHCRDAYYLRTADGRALPIWETNLRLKIDSSARGPGERGPAMLASGMAGDRASVVFSSVAQMRDLLVEMC